MPVLTRLTKADVDSLARKLEELASDAATAEECAQRWCFHLYDHLAQKDGSSACVLVRCFRTARFGDLSTELRALAARAAGLTETPEATPCLVLMGTAGANADWNSRHRSANHRVIPLPSPEIVARSPMIAQLFRQLGVDVHEVVGATNPASVTATSALNVFYVADAQGSLHIPAQSVFVLPYNVHTVFGFGGLLPSANVFAFILFTQVSLDADTATLFQDLAESLKPALARFDTA